MKKIPLVYVIEDDDVYRKYINIVLQKKCQLEPQLFCDLSSAWSSIDQVVPDIVILDYRLPDFNGDEWMIRLSETCRLDQCHVIVLTGYRLTEKETFGLYSLGVENIFTKPLDKELFVATIQEKISLIAAD